MAGSAQTGLTVDQRARWTHLQIYRGVAWAGAVLQPLEIGFQVVTDNPHGPLLLRWVVVAGLLAFLAATYASEWARRHVGELALLFTLIPLANTASDLFASHVGRMAVLATCVTMFAVSLVLHERRLVLVFLSVWAGVLGGLSFLVPDPVVDPPIAAATFVAVAVLIAFVVSRYMHLRAQQVTADSIMEVLFERAADGILFGPLGMGPQRANQRARDLLQTDDLARIRELLAAAWEEASPTHAAEDAPEDRRRTCKVTTAKGNHFWADIVVRRIRTESATLLMVRVTDVGMHMAVEAQMRAAKEVAEAAVSMRDRFLANVSHEIRTPMNGVIAMTSLMLNSPLSDQQRELLSAIRTSGETMLAIINEILDFSKLEAGAVTLERQPFDVEHCAMEAIGIVAPVALAKGIEIVLDDTGLRHAQFQGDVSRFRQVLLNLLSNAVKFTHRGLVEVQVGETLLDGVPAVRVAVQDTGIGIDAALQDALFEPFTQADASTTRRYGGTGLGLSICKTLVEKMGGRIGVDSTPGQGACFEFVLPLPAVPESALPAPADPLGATGGRKVLSVCIAQPALLRVCTAAAQAAGFDVACHDTAERALAAVDVHAVLLDLAEAAGAPAALAAARTARGAGATAMRVPVLGLLALDGASAPAPGIDVELRKPLHPSDLRASLARIARGEPVAADVRRESASAALPPLAAPVPSVLLAEDNAINQLVGRRVLESLGIAADVAADGREVLQMLAQRRYDVVLMDVQMPELDGIEATRAIRGDSEAHQPYIIAMTANVLPSDRAACTAAGMDDFVGKPIRVADVHAALGRAIAGLGSRAAVGSTAT